MSLMKSSVRRKLTALMIIVSGGTLLLVCAALMAYDRLNDSREMATRDSVESSKLAAAIASPLQSHDLNALNAILEKAGQNPTLLYSAVWNLRGARLAQFRRPDHSEDVLYVRPEEGISVGIRSIVVSQSIVKDGKPIGTSASVFDLSMLNDRWTSYATIVIVFMAASLFVSILIGAWLQQHITVPILTLVNIAREVSDRKDYSIRAARHGHDELGMLVDEFNCMLAEIEERDRELQQSKYILEEEIRVRSAINEQLADAKEAAESASRAKSEFLANMSHEIRTPMNAIMGMTELALETDLNSEQREYLTTVKSSAEALLSVINDVLDFSKIEAGRLDLDHVPFDIDELLGDTLRGIALRAHQKGLELAYDLEPEVPTVVVGDDSRLRQVLINLIGNAIKFTESGEVVLRVGLEHSTESDCLLHFTVRDTGIGIPKGKLGVIFEAFGQADGSSARKYGGTGLGLTISSRIVSMMRGKIWVESVVGEGSTFHFTVQLGRTDGQPLKVVPAEVETLKGMRALIVDDNRTNRQILHAMLTQWQMTASQTSGGPEALLELGRACASGQPYPLILIDGQMPEMDGFELAGEIKRDPRLAGATVMMLTSATRHGDAARCKNLGICSYLIKPIRRPELLQSILVALGRRSGEARNDMQKPIETHMRRLNILLAEDNVVNQQLALRLLQKENHLVRIAQNGKEAVAAHSAETFDLVLMDVQMPEMDGFEATAAIRRQDAIGGIHTPIIAMTAHAMKGDRERCLAAGMDDYLSKPIHRKELLLAIAHHCAEIPNSNPGGLYESHEQGSSLGENRG